MTTRIQHLMEALHHLSQVDGFDLEISRIQRSIKDVYEANTEDLEGIALIDRLSDIELAAAIRIQEPRLGLYSPFINPDIFNYIRRERPTVAAREFSRPR